MKSFDALKSSGEYAYFFNCTLDSAEKYLKVGLAVFAMPIRQAFTIYSLSGDKVAKLKPPEEIASMNTGCTMADSLDQVLFELEEVYI